MSFIKNLLYKAASNLENRTIECSHGESEDTLPINKKKIRREIMINGEKVWITADTEQEYAQKLLKVAGSNVTRNKKTLHNFKDYAENWFNVFSKPNVETVTALCYERQLRCHIYPVIGAKAIEEITVSDIQEVFNRIGDDVKQETKNKTKIVLNQIFKMAVEDGYAMRNPLNSVALKIKGLAPSVTEPYTLEQMQYFAAHLDDIPDPTERAWLALCIALPLRPEEVLGLQWMNLSEDHSTLAIRNTVTHPTRNKPLFKSYLKTEASNRDLVLPPEVISYLPERGKPEEFIIGGEAPISYTKLRGMRKRIAKAIGFEGTITPRRFRTTVATDISALTHDLKLVQQMLGHATPQMTLKHYDKGRGRTIDASNAVGRCYGIARSRL